jgi:shikimate kinase
MAERGEAIVLIGFMGSGKSSAGRALAARTGLPRYDTDEMVAARYGLSIAEIFAQHGEEAFRAAETAALAQVPQGAAIVVTGGGIVMRAENVECLRRFGIIVHLTADEETLFARVSRRQTRPLLQTENPRQTLSELLRVRAPLYHQAADWTVDTSELRHEEVADQILEQIGELRLHVR